MDPFRRAYVQRGRLGQIVRNRGACLLGLFPGRDILSQMLMAERGETDSTDVRGMSDIFSETRMKARVVVCRSKGYERKPLASPVLDKMSKRPP